MTFKSLAPEKHFTEPLCFNEATLTRQNLNELEFVLDVQISNGYNA